MFICDSERVSSLHPSSEYQFKLHYSSPEILTFLVLTDFCTLYHTFPLYSSKASWDWFSVNVGNVWYNLHSLIWNFLLFIIIILRARIFGDYHQDRTYGSSHSQTFLKIVFSWKFRIFHRKTPVLESFFNKVAGLMAELLQIQDHIIFATLNWKMLVAKTRCP